MRSWSRYNTLFRSERSGGFLYNALSNVLLQLDERHYRLLTGLRDGGGEPVPACADEGELPPAPADGFLRLLAQRHVLVEDGEEEAILLERRRRRDAAYRERSLLDLTICPTLACNFRCTYCYQQSQGDAQVMSGETIHQLARFVADYEGVDRLSVCWYGGEPTLAFAAIREITDRLRSLDISFCGADMITNGYLLDRTWIGALDDLGIGRLQVTLDGPQPVHDARRLTAGGGPTFHRILRNLDQLTASTWTGECRVRVNVDRDNVDEYLSLRSYLLERYAGTRLGVYAGRVSGVSGQVREACRLDATDWAELTLSLYREAHITPAGGFFPDPEPLLSCTAAMANAYVVGPSGELYSCWETVGRPDEAVGHVSPGRRPNHEWMPAAHDDAGAIYPHEWCRRCPVLPICAAAELSRCTGGGRTLCAATDTCSLYRDYLIPYLEAYYDQYLTRELCEQVAGSAVRTGEPLAYREIQPPATGP